MDPLNQEASHCNPPEKIGTRSQHQQPQTPYSEQTTISQPQGGAFVAAAKLLVSNNVAGSIIGRAGQTISELQAQSSARIRLSQAGDFYPGTQDRVCLVQGQHESVKMAFRLLLERLYMLQEQHHPSSSFNFVVRILVPSSSCGMLIGKAGSNIKRMEELSGVSSIRLSPKENHNLSLNQNLVFGTSERIVTLTGPTMENCLSCLYIILDIMVANHEICRYTNMTTSYSRLAMHSPLSGRINLHQ